MDLIEEKKGISKPGTINSTRIFLLFVLVLVTFLVKFFSKKPPFPILPIILSLGTAIAIAGVHYLLLRIMKLRPAIYVQLSTDIIFITILVFFSGGVESPFYFLYILPIIVSSIYLSRKDTIYIAALSFIIFGALSELMYLKIPPFFTLGTAEEVQEGTFIYNLVMSMIGFASVALISSYYFEKIRTTGVELRTIRENLKDLDLLNRTVLEKMENGYLTSNSSGAILSFNEKAKSFLNIDHRSNVFELLFNEPDYTKITRIVESTNRYYFETDHDELVLGISVSALRNIYSYEKVYVFIITDLTERRAIEEELKKKEHLAIIGEMSAGMAHEIRNPLASISGSVQFLRREMELAPEFQNLMDIIVKESERLSRSIEEFLEFSKTTPLETSDFPLGALIDDIIELASISNREIDFIKKFCDDDIVSADRKKIEQMVWNLINNAVKAVNGQGTIEVNIYEKDGKIYLSIKDDGSGIEESEIKNIFNPFYSRFSSGIGLGMAIVKRIVEEHRFDIVLNSEKDLGTEVIVCFKKT